MYHIKFKHKYFTGLKYSRFKDKAKIFPTFNDAKDFLLTSNIQGVIVKRRVRKTKVKKKDFQKSYVMYQILDNIPDINTKQNERFIIV